MRTKKYPILTYVCYLLALAIVLTGVTLSRYVSSSGGGANVGVSPFACSFTVDEISSTAFTNMNYWYTPNGATTSNATNSPHSLGFTVRNYDEEGRISGVDLGNTLRICAPAELLDNVAFQLAKNENGAPIAVTPQYVFSNVVNNIGGGLSDTKYGAMSYPNEENAALSISGNIVSGTGKVDAKTADGLSIVVTAERIEKTYSVAFNRGTEYAVKDGDITHTYVDSSGAVLYLDCKKEEVYYTVDIILPDSALSGGSKEEKSYLLYFTTINEYIGGDYGATFSSDFSKGLNDAEITGYHFDIPDVALYKKVVNAETSETQFAEVSKTSVRVVHDIETGTSEYYCIDGSSLNKITYGADEYLPCGDYYVAKDDLYDDYTDGGSYKVGTSMGKIYPFEIKVLFWQTSAVPENEGGSL